MTSRRVLKSVLHNFLGTYTSRYSDYQGYWLFGFLVGYLEHLEIDLLASTSEESGSAVSVATDLAAKRFADQVCKSGIDLRLICDARLCIERPPSTNPGTVNGRPSAGYSVRFRATATVDTGRIFESERVLFVAPHNPLIESRSNRAY